MINVSVVYIRYFPDMLLEFVNHVEHVWRPTSYLYKKGKAKVHCMTIVSEDQSAENSNVNGGNLEQGSSHGRTLTISELGRTDKTTSLGRRRLQKDVNQAVLGSSFFINHDIIFHLGRWELAFFEAECPITDLNTRRTH